MDQVDQADRQRRPEPREIGGIALEAGERGVGVGLALERHASGEALVQDQPERVQIGAPVELAAPNLLGRQVLGRSHHHVVAREIGVGDVETLGDAEVRQQHPPIGRQQDVGRLDVAMDEAGTVGLVERARNRRADVDGELRTEALLTVEQLAEALAVDELHHHGLAAVVLEHVVDGDDVGVVQPGDGDRFAPEPFGDHGIGGEVRLEPLDGDPAVELDVGGDPHLGHPTVTDPPFEVVPLREQLDGRVGDGRRGRGWRSRRGHDRQFTLVVPTAGFWAFATNDGTSCRIAARRVSIRSRAVATTR